LFLLCLAGFARTQDTHFSQFYNAPTYYNPAATGAFPQKFRTNIFYKTQWKNIDVTYTHSFFSGEINLFKKDNGSHLGLGLNVLNDRTGMGLMNQTYVSMSSAYHVLVGRDQFLSAGIQLGYGQRSLNNGNLTWDNQYDDGIFNPALPYDENLNMTKSFADVGAGVMWNGLIGNNVNVNFGLAGFHLNKPVVSFMNDQNEKLHHRYSAFSSAKIPLPLSNTTVIPSVMYSLQGGHHEAMFGTLIRYELREASKYTGFIKGTAFGIGGHYRVKDAFVPSMFVEMGGFQFGASYDINVSGLKNATNGRGGFEFSLKFVNPNPFLDVDKEVKAFF